MSAILAITTLAIVLLVYGWLALLAIKRGAGKRFNPRVDPFVVLIRWEPVAVKLSPMLQRPRLLLSTLHGGSCSNERLVGWAAESAGIGFFALAGTALLAWIGHKPNLLVVGLALGGCMPFLRLKELSGSVAKRRQSILLALPDLLGKLLLMVDAGENAMKAFAKAVEQAPDREHPLYVEAKSALEAIGRGESMTIAFEEMGRRCAVPEVKLFATTLIINARRGGDAFVPAMKELTRQMWEKRKAIARTLGEQASSRMAFPLTVIFLIIMALVGAPAVLMM
ncbi:type II secretion system F family protein [Cohnella suwonensis]|uniref:Type II secretion system F family protein n=1 Tax=Cohnella suwonensis TaxID=696072 RepID=A0ABW0M012_9BACL